MIYDDIELQDCPLCHGAGLMEEENGWCLYVACLDCDAHTVEIPFKNEEQKREAAEKVGHLWNAGKVISGNPNE